MRPETRARISAAMKGRRNSRGNANVTEDQVREIRRLYAAGEMTITQLAERFNCRSIYQLLVGKNWGHVPGALSREEVHRIGCANRASGTRLWWNT